ncbi:MAG: uncharacterized protein A8A55_2523 [Amphiamblys sp. WSBS2006]|nr:MAG: uncharacterized protein A8A55_2523 [Amphiamblys sp. WSBS2006]
MLERSAKNESCPTWKQEKLANISGTAELSVVPGEDGKDRARGENPVTRDRIGKIGSRQEVTPINTVGRKGMWAILKLLSGTRGNKEKSLRARESRGIHEP